VLVPQEEVADDARTDDANDSAKRVPLLLEPVGLQAVRVSKAKGLPDEGIVRLTEDV